ncbi:unnamed protein product [Camellia sinensis]
MAPTLTRVPPIFGPVDLLSYANTDSTVAARANGEQLQDIYTDGKPTQGGFAGSMVTGQKCGVHKDLRAQPTNEKRLDRGRVRTKLCHAMTSESDRGWNMARKTPALKDMTASIRRYPRAELTPKRRAPANLAGLQRPPEAEEMVVEVSFEDEGFRGSCDDVTGRLSLGREAVEGGARGAEVSDGSERERLVFELLRHGMILYGLVCYCLIRMMMIISFVWMIILCCLICTAIVVPNSLMPCAPP